jgi:hypothetical protein
VGVSQVYLGQLFFKLAVRPQYRSRAVDLFTPAQLKTTDRKRRQNLAHFNPKPTLRSVGGGCLCSGRPSG